MPFSLIDSFKESTQTHSILLVDDEDQQLKYLQMILQHAGYDVIKTSSAHEALKCLETATPDLILSDLNMPGMDGIEFCREVYLNDAFLNIPFVFISGINDDLFKLQASEAGAIDYLSKPFTPEDILEKVSHVLKLVQKNNLTDVLFVAKESDTALQKKDKLREKGIVLHFVDTAKMAIENIHTQKYNLVLSEPQLNDISAFEFCRILKQDAFKNIPFITYSKAVTSNMYSEGLKIGVNDFWNSGYTAKELASKIQSYLRKYSDKEVYPRGICERLDNSSVIEIARQISIEKKTGILAVSNTHFKGHIHFNEGHVSDAYANTYEGVEAFYTLMTMGRGGVYRFVRTDASTGPVTETPENLFLYAEKLNSEIKSIWEKQLEINKKSKTRPKGIMRQFVKQAKSGKEFWQILWELGLDAYHGFLILEKLIENGKVISPVSDLFLMEFDHV